MIANERFTVTPALTQDTRTVAMKWFYMLLEWGQNAAICILWK